MFNLTIVIPVKNEEANLAACLQAIGKGFAHSVVVVDSGSTDKTAQIARHWGARLVHFEWDGRYPKKRNWFLLHHRPETEWVLFLDADEFLTPAFKTALAGALQSKTCVGYWLSYTNYFMGHRLRGGYPLQKLALFRVGAGLYEYIPETGWSNLDMEVHEHPILEGPVGHIKACIDHQDFNGIQHYLAKHTGYATWEAQRFLRLHHTGQLTPKQKLKYRLMGSGWMGLVYFVGSFLLMGGFRDGKRGFLFAVFKMAYFNQVYCRLQEAKQKPAHPVVKMQVSQVLH